MRQNTFLISLGGLALLLWAGLLAFMNSQYPDALNQMAFLAIWGAAISCTAIPIAYMLNARAFRARSRPHLTRNRAIRQGILAGLVALALMALRFMQMLTPVTAIPIILVAVLGEMVVNVRRR